MVKAYFSDPGEDMFMAFHNMLERDTKKKIFTMRVLEDYGNAAEGVDLLVVFEDQSVLKANVSFPADEMLPGIGMMGLRVKANFI